MNVSIAGISIVSGEGMTMHDGSSTYVVVAHPDSPICHHHPDPSSGGPFIRLILLRRSLLSSSSWAKCIIITMDRWLGPRLSWSSSSS
jgi:hypothetical protein